MAVKTRVVFKCLGEFTGPSFFGDPRQFHEGLVSYLGMVRCLAIAVASIAPKRETRRSPPTCKLGNGLKTLRKRLSRAATQHDSSAGSVSAFLPQMYDLCRICTLYGRLQQGSRFTCTITLFFDPPLDPLPLQLHPAYDKPKSIEATQSSFPRTCVLRPAF